MKKFISTLSVILVFTVFLCACVPESKNEITKLDFAEKYSDFELEAGEISEEFCLFVTAKGKFDEATIIANSDNPAVATVVEKTYDGSDTFKFRIEAIGTGTAHIWFETADKSVKTPEIKIKVTERKTATTNAPETEFSTTESTTESVVIQTENETSPTDKTVYVTPTGKKYHYSKSCAGKNATPKSFEDAKRHYDPCKKCAHD